MVNGSVQMVTSGGGVRVGAEQGRRSEGRPWLRLAAGILGRRRQRRVGLGQTGQAGRFGSEHRPPRDAHVREALGGRRGSGG